MVMNSSIRNRLPGTIERIVSDKVVSEIVIRTAAGEVTSVITTGSVQRMNLKEGDQVFVITNGGIGSVPVSFATLVSNTVTFQVLVHPGQSSFFFGLVSTHPPGDVDELIYLDE